jgi:hypothetical protein
MLALEVRVGCLHKIVCQWGENPHMLTLEVRVRVFAQECVSVLGKPPHTRT